MTTYREQAEAVKRYIRHLERSVKELEAITNPVASALIRLEAEQVQLSTLRDACTSLLALSMIGEGVVVQADRLRKVASELVMEVLVDGRELSAKDVFDYAHDFNQIINEKAST